MSYNHKSDYRLLPRIRGGNYIPLPSFYYEGRRESFDQGAFVEWFNNLGYRGRGKINSQRANSIMKKHALNTFNHLKEYMKFIYSYDQDLEFLRDEILDREDCQKAIELQKLKRRSKNA